MSNTKVQVAGTTVEDNPPFIYDGGQAACASCGHTFRPGEEIIVAMESERNKEAGPIFCCDEDALCLALFAQDTGQTVGGASAYFQCAPRAPEKEKRYTAQETQSQKPKNSFIAGVCLVVAVTSIVALLATWIWIAL